MIIYDTKQSSVYQLDMVSTTTWNIQPQFLLPIASLAKDSTVILYYT